MIETPTIELLPTSEDLLIAGLHRTLISDDKTIEIEEGWESWLRTVLPGSYRKHGTDIPFSDFHERFWNYVWQVEKGKWYAPYIQIVFRGGGKSTNTENACIALGARKARRYVLYVSETQAQADKHVQSIAGKLESSMVSEYYPDLAEREVTKYGDSKGWRRNRLYTASGFIIDAIGLDVASRGIKLEDDRPDAIILDDIDGLLDTPRTTEKKIETLTNTILPAGSDDAVVIGVQNLIHPNSIFSQLADGRADFLTNRTIDGPIPAINDMAYETVDGKASIVSGTPTWAGMNIEDCQRHLDKEGLTAFLRERQHEVKDRDGGMFSHIEFSHIDFSDVPELDEIQVWVDPAVTDTDNSDNCAIQADGRSDGKVYRLYSWEERSSPRAALRRAVEKAVDLQAQVVGVETNQGGDLWKNEFDEVVKELYYEYMTIADEQEKERKLFVLTSLSFKQAKAGSADGPKAHRWQTMLSAYERGEIVHVRGTSHILEAALKRLPKFKPFDLADAAYHAWNNVSSAGMFVEVDFKNFWK